MGRMKKDPWYSFELENYSAPSCTSSTKLFFGTVDDFRQVLQGIPNGKMDELKCTFERFEAGERRISHYAGYIKTRFAIPVRVLDEKPLEFQDVNYLYENSYGFYYRIRFTKVSGKIYLLRRNKRFYVAYRAEVENAEYSDAQQKETRWHSLGDQIWGHPGIIRVKNKTIKNLLAVSESRFDDEPAARGRFNDFSSFDWSYFFQDVFGDG